MRLWDVSSRCLDFRRLLFSFRFFSMQDMHVSQMTEEEEGGGGKERFFFFFLAFSLQNKEGKARVRSGFQCKTKMMEAKERDWTTSWKLKGEKKQDVLRDVLCISAYFSQRREEKRREKQSLSGVLGERQTWRRDRRQNFFHFFLTTLLAKSALSSGSHFFVVYSFLFVSFCPASVSLFSFLSSFWVRFRKTLFKERERQKRKLEDKLNDKLDWFPSPAVLFFPQTPTIFLLLLFHILSIHSIRSDSRKEWTK